MRRVTVAAVRRRLSRARAASRSVQAELRERRRRLGPRAAADFEHWLDRQVGRTRPEFPDVWRVLPQAQVADPVRVAVVVHVFYADLFAEILNGLHHVPVPFDLIITNASGAPVVLPADLPPMLRHRMVLDVENHGRDIWPTIQVINSGLLDPYELVLKLHTKRSQWRQEHADLGGSGDQWRSDLLGSLVGSDEQVRAILSAFAADPDLGVVTAPGNVLGPEFWGADLPLTREVLRRLELSVDPDRLQFPSGSVYWCRAFVLQGLRALNMGAADFEPEPAIIDGTTMHAVERSIGILTTEAGLSIRSTDELGPVDPDGWRRYLPEAPRFPRARVVPFYLPQFHPSAENDQWWGKGFSEWSNVTTARPVYRGHNQPNLPTELGFYDLRLDDVRAEQTRLATDHGVEGFMYYFYWFAGRQVLSLPVNALVEGDVPMSFCLMWANENWTRRWDGRSSDVLLGQDYEHVPAEGFIDDVMHLLQDKRYLRLDGRAVLAVYRVGQIPDFPTVVAHWRARARAEGVGELLVLSVDVAREFDGLVGRAEQHDIDGTLGFPPHNHLWEWVPHGGLHVQRGFRGNLLSYGAMVRDAERRLNRLDDSAFPGVMVTFDNTARRQAAPDVWFGSNPYTFRRWVAAATSAVAHRERERRVVFLNAWNEWAESAVLEPSVRNGRTYLQALRDVVHG